MPKKLIPFIFMIGLFVSFAFASYLRTPLTYSPTEQRPLAQHPTLNKEFGTELNNYTNDQFYFRDRLMQIKSKLQRLLGQRYLNGIWVRNDMLFQEGISLTNEHQEQLINAFRQFQKQTKLKPKMMIVGDRINLLEDEVSKDMVTIDSLKDIASLQEHLSDFAWIDVNSVLKNQRDAFYVSDHHYTSKGAYLCFEAYRKQFLAKEKAYKYDILPYTNQFLGTLANQSRIRDYQDIVELYVPQNSDISYLCKIADTTTTSIYNQEKGASQNAYEIFFGGNHPLVELTTTVKNNKHLLIVKDSFANAFVPFLIPYYHRITMVDPRYYYDNIYQYIKNENVNDVLFLYSSQTLFKDTSLIDFTHTKP